MKATRRAKRATAACGGISGAPDMDDDMIEIDLGGGSKMIGTANFMREFMVPAAEELNVTRANAAVENQKT